ncbi:MAG: UDP-N-acetylmuramate dehydrogenase [Crocinitomicaceae bacterium]|nr:UDP-N-acetylmuramate dehydrogenase [Crocinitomicaceae bacterium]MDG1777494.1 UDP-N-acetylmuramate dehydrogenase [Crocinitomicaceae bacterium]
MISTNVNLKEHNTFGISVNSSRFATFTSVDDLTQVLAKREDSKLLILGGGSNILFTKDFDGLVLKNEIKGFEIIHQDNDIVQIKVGAGEVWHDFVMKCIDLRFAGIENLSLIPGSVGASPMQNIGAYGVEIKDVFVELEAYHINSGKTKIFSKEECQFGYRESVFKREFKDQYIITSVTYELNMSSRVNSSYGAIQHELESNGIKHPTIKDISNAVIKIRSSKLPNPKEIGNAGSFFKNPIVGKDVLSKLQNTFEKVPNYPAPEGKVKLAAGWLIEQAGWKGKTVGNHGVHKNQALVLVNYSDALGDEILTLSTQIINDVTEKFGVTLEREVNII